MVLDFPTIVSAKCAELQRQLVEEYHHAVHHLEKQAEHCAQENVELRKQLDKLPVPVAHKKSDKSVVHRQASVGSSCSLLHGTSNSSLQHHNSGGRSHERQRSSERQEHGSLGADAVHTSTAWSLGTTTTHHGADAAAIDETRAMTDPSIPRVVPPPHPPRVVPPPPGSLEPTEAGLPRRPPPLELQVSEGHGFLPDRNSWNSSILASERDSGELRGRRNPKADRHMDRTGSSGSLPCEFFKGRRGSYGRTGSNGSSVSGFGAGSDDGDGSPSHGEQGHNARGGLRARRMLGVPQVVHFASQGKKCKHQSSGQSFPQSPSGASTPHSNVPSEAVSMLAMKKWRKKLTGGTLPDSEPGTPRSGASPRNSNHSDGSVDTLEFTLCDIWQNKIRESRTSRRKSNNMFLAFRSNSNLNLNRMKRRWEIADGADIDIDKQPCLAWVMERVIVHPNSPKRILWEVLSFFLILYDIVTVPLQAFNPPDTLFTDAMAWVVRLFWVLDIGVSFLTGYVNRQGCLIMHPRQIARHYIRQQMHLDVFVVIADWVEVVASNRAAGMLRVWRIVRFVRVLRLKKFREIIERVKQRSRSESFGVVTSLAKMNLQLVILSHIIACGWAGVSLLEPPSRRTPELYAEDERPLLERYTQAFHFAIAIFYGEHVIMPVGTAEKIYTILCLILTFTLQIWFVSFITTAMTHLEIMSRQRVAQFAALHRFMTANNVPQEVALKVERNAAHALDEQLRNAPESSIELLELISDPLMMELHMEIHWPVLQRHPFFRCFAEINLSSIRNLCHHAIIPFSVSKDDVLFNILQAPHKPSMLFVVSGTLEYQDVHGKSHLITSRNWLSEATLWAKEWFHCGTLQAVTDCRMLAVDAQAFQQFIGAAASPHASEYAQKYVETLQSKPPEDYTDVGEYTSELGLLLSQVFPDEFAAIRNEFEHSPRRRGNASFQGVFPAELSDDQDHPGSPPSSCGPSPTNGGRRGSAALTSVTEEASIHRLPNTPPVIDSPS